MATRYTHPAGNVCKVTSVLINILIWDKHASMMGIGFLLACLVAAAAYQPAPLRTLEVSSAHLIGDDTEAGYSDEMTDATQPRPQL